MTDAGQFLVALPDWAGSAPSWALFLVALVAAIKTWPIIQKNVSDARENKESRMGKRITELEDKIKACHDECEEKLRLVNNELHGLRKQHIQEQISFVQAIIASIDTPELKLLLRTLENGSRALQAIRPLGNVAGDALQERDGEE